MLISAAGEKLERPVVDFIQEQDGGYHSEEELAAMKGGGRHRPEALRAAVALSQGDPEPAVAFVRAESAGAKRVLPHRNARHHPENIVGERGKNMKTPKNSAFENIDYVAVILHSFKLVSIELLPPPGLSMGPRTPRPSGSTGTEMEQKAATLPQ